MLIRGDRLTPRQRALVLAAFLYRWTTGNPHRKQVYRCPHCDLVNIQPDSLPCRQHHPTIPLQTDDAWVEEHAFHFIGTRLSEKNNYAEPAYLAH